MTIVFDLQDLKKTSYQLFFGSFCVKEHVRSLRAPYDEMRVFFKKSMGKNLSGETEESFVHAEIGGLCEQLSFNESQENSTNLTKTEQNKVKVSQIG